MNLEDLRNKDLSSSYILNKILNRGSIFEEDYLEIVLKIIKEVKEKKDKALIKFAKEFDKVDLNEKTIELSKEELEKAYKSCPKDLLEALEKAFNNIVNFHKNQLEKSFFVDNKNGILGQIVKPIEKVGIYVPSGKAFYPSTVLMNAGPAKVAGVKEIYMVSPKPNNEILAAAYIAGVTKVFRVGGAQAIAALAFGTDTIPKVDKIVGPGNIYVALAKKLVFGQVGIDMIAGPSEILILADESEKPEHVAIDMLSQAEHDELASAVAITTNAEFAKDIQKALEKELETLPRKEVAQKSLENYGAIFIVENWEEAAKLSNIIAPEHLEIHTKNPFDILPLIENAGAIFIGKYSVEALGDYVAGPNHTLPTSTTSRFSSPLGVYDFIKRSSFIFINEEGFKNLKDYAIKIAYSEGLHAHALSLEKRVL